LDPSGADARPRRARHAAGCALIVQPRVTRLDLCRLQDVEISDILAAIGLVLLALGGGTFWSFSTGVMPGLGRTDDDTFVSSMRSINRAVVNPLFLLPIFLPPIPLVWAGLIDLDAPRGWMLVAAGAVFFGGVIVVTVGGNVPLNNALDGSTSSSTAARAAFERRWNVLNGVRSLTSVAAIVLAVLALVV